MPDTKLRIRVDGATHTCSSDAQATIGSSPEATVQVRHPGISRFHALVRATSDNWLLEDTNSLNGTYHEGSKVESLEVLSSTRVRLGHPEEGLEVQLEVVEPQAQPSTRSIPRLAPVRDPEPDAAAELWDMPWEELVEQVARRSPESILQARATLEAAESQRKLIAAVWALAASAIVLAAVTAIVAIVAG